MPISRIAALAALMRVVVNWYKIVPIMPVPTERPSSAKRDKEHGNRKKKYSETFHGSSASAILNETTTERNGSRPVVANTKKSEPAAGSYSPGVIRCAVEVPGFMIHTPPALPLSGKPSDAVVAPGTAIVIWRRGVVRPRKPFALY